MVIFNALSRTVFPSTRRIIQGSVLASHPFLYGNAIQNRFQTKSRLCQELSSSASAVRKFNLSFEDYIKLKGEVRRNQIFVGIPFALLGCWTWPLITMTYICPDMFDATPENVQLILGLDPLLFTGISGTIAAGFGYFIGVAVYKIVWRKWNKDRWSDLDARDRDFLQRLDKYRFGADSKFEDDYYGESIKNLSDYRQWIRTHQRRKENHEKYELSALKSKLE